MTHTDFIFSLQIARSGAIPVLVSMLQKAEDDTERLNACKTLWTLAFDEENRNEINGIESAIAELRKLLTSKNNELKKAAGGALWECEGKKKHAEEKQLSISAPEVSGIWIDDQTLILYLMLPSPLLMVLLKLKDLTKNSLVEM